MARYTQDQLDAQKNKKKMRMAGDKLAGEGKTYRDLDREQKSDLRSEYGITYAGKDGTQYFNDKGNLTDITEDNNPFKVDSLADFDEKSAAMYGRGAQKGRSIINAADVKRLQAEGGYSPEEMAEAFKDMKMGKGAKNWLARKGVETPEGTIETPAVDNEGSDGIDNEPVISTPETSSPGTPAGPGSPNQPGIPTDFSGVFVGGDLNQNIGKQGDMNNTIGDGNTFGAGLNFGNDYSVTIGSQSVGSGSSSSNASRLLAAQAKERTKAFMS